MIGRGQADDVAQIFEVINEAAAAYRGVIPADRWHEPYMPLAELRAEIAAGVEFWCWRRQQTIEGVMGLQQVADVALIRHAYTRTRHQAKGIGSRLLQHLVSLTDKPLLVGTWKAADWAVRFYERRGFRLVADGDKARLLRRYWNVSERQIEESVVLQCSVRSEPQP
jgi:GNAT superfamily N-acetyltransferase